MSHLRNNATIDDFLHSCRLALENAQNTPEIQAALDVFNYTAAVLGEGMGLLETAEQRHALQKQEYGDQYAATEAVDLARLEADEIYGIHRKLAQLALKKSPKQQASLGLAEQKKESLSGWLGQATIFYTNSLSDAAVISALARFNIDETKLAEGQAMVQQVIDLNAVQEKEKYQAQQATKDRDAALDALDEWFADFREVAKIALADKPQQLEALGFGAVP